MNDKKDIKQLAEELYFEARKQGLDLMTVTFHKTGISMDGNPLPPEIEVDAILTDK